MGGQRNCHRGRVKGLKKQKTQAHNLVGEQERTRPEKKDRDYLSKLEGAPGRRNLTSKKEPKGNNSQAPHKWGTGKRSRENVLTNGNEDQPEW